MVYSSYLETTEGKTLFQDLTIDTATIDNIFAWFQFRDICDETRFRAYFRRKLSLHLKQYDELVRIDLTKIDPLVSSYRERLAKHSGETTNTGESKTTTSHAGSETTTTANSGTDSTSSEHTPDLTTTTDNTGTQANQGMGKQNPQAIAYTGTSGMPDEFDWQYSSTQQESRRRDDLHQETTNTGTETTDVSTTYGHTTTVTHTPNVTDTNVGSNSGKQTTDDTDKEIWTGRDGLTPQEALTKMREYIRGTTAMQWLLNKLEPCFIGIYEI